MKCVNCPYSLSCLAGRLDYHDGKNANFVLLCPQCNRLMLGLKDVVEPGQGQPTGPSTRRLAIFDCEQRHHTETVMAGWRDACARDDTAREQGYAFPDMGPGLRGKLTVGLCFQCADMQLLHSSSSVVTVQYLDENKTETIEPKDVPHASRQHDPR